VSTLEQLEPIEDLEDKTFSPYVDDFGMRGVGEPYALIAAIRAQGPVVEGSYRKLAQLAPTPWHEDKPHFMVLSYDAVDQVLNDPVTFSNAAFEPTLGRFRSHGQCHGSTRAHRLP
jgi:cytochrome P450